MDELHGLFASGSLFHLGLLSALPSASECPFNVFGAPDSVVHEPARGTPGLEGSSRQETAKRLESRVALSEQARAAKRPVAKRLEPARAQH